MVQRYRLSWGSSHDGKTHQRTLCGVTELYSVLDAAEFGALEYGCVLQVDLWPERAGADDLILLQWLTGHPCRSSVLCHHDGGTVYATDRRVAPLHEDIAYERTSGPGSAEPSLTRLTPGGARQVLEVYLMTGREADGLSWTALPQD